MWLWDWLWRSTEEGSGGGGEGQKKVVIIGGGIGGVTVAYRLQSLAQVTLIDSKEYLEIPWASVRSFVEPSFAERALINHSEFLPKVRVIITAATNVTENEVATADGEMIEYTHLVVATGHVGYVYRTKADKLSYYQSEFEKISSASSILIIGGGPSAVELAGEIAVDFPDKKLTLVHRGSRLLEFIGAKASQKTLDWLTSKKVQVILDQSVDLTHASEGTYQVSNGETISANCHFTCTGLPMGSSWLRETALKDSMDIQGRLMVDDKLRVRGHKNVFAVGDVTDISEIKLGHLSQKHARVVAKNIKALLMDGKENMMVKYNPGSPAAVVSLGRVDAVAQFRLFTSIGRFPGMMKSNDLYVGKTRKQLGLDPYPKSAANGEEKPKETAASDKDK